MLLETQASTFIELSKIKFWQWETYLKEILLEKGVGIPGSYSQIVVAEDPKQTQILITCRCFISLHLHNLVYNNMLMICKALYTPKCLLPFSKLYRYLFYVSLFRFYFSVGRNKADSVHLS